MKHLCRILYPRTSLLVCACGGGGGGGGGGEGGGVLPPIIVRLKVGENRKLVRRCEI